MSRHMAAKYLVEHRTKRKRRETEEEEVEEPAVPPRPAMTNAERQRQYRKRKKLERENVDVGAREDAAVAADPEPVLNIALEPAPGRSTDPIRFYPNLDPVRFRTDSVGDIAQADSVAIHGKCFAVRFA